MECPSGKLCTMFVQVPLAGHIHTRWDDFFQGEKKTCINKHCTGFPAAFHQLNRHVLKIQIYPEQFVDKSVMKCKF